MGITRWIFSITLLVGLSASLSIWADEKMEAQAPNLRTFADDVERDYAIRTIGQLQVTNMRGDISIQGWALDKIRVKARRKVQAENESQAKLLFSALDFRYQTLGGDIELAAEYGKGLTIQERWKERENPRTSMEMVVYAPAHLKLRVWAVDGKVVIKSWNAGVEVRTSKGPIHVEGVKSESIALLCPTCPMEVKLTQGSVRCMGGDGPIDLDHVDGSHIYAESNKGPLHANNVQGEQLYVSKSGNITGQRLNGHIAFHTQQASVDIADSAGLISGRTETGNISAKMREWVFSDKALIESSQGNIELGLPARFSGDVDIWSMAAKAEVDFPIEEIQEHGPPGNRGAGHVIGRIGSGGELLKVTSEKGNIHISRTL